MNNSYRIDQTECDLIGATDRFDDVKIDMYDSDDENKDLEKKKGQIIEMK